MDINTPVIFSDGTEFFEQLGKDYIKHAKGLFILAPSGAGKTYFVTKQVELHWIDGDTLWPAAGADPLGDDWVDDFEVVQEVNNRSDIITEQAKKQGFWVIGSSNSWLKPDAIVLPEWEQHKQRIVSREHSDYDGGAKEQNLKGVIEHRKWIRHWVDLGVPEFESIEQAVARLTKGK